MRKYLTAVLWVLLVFIHTLDMELTSFYVGNDPLNETFPPMRWAIGVGGIHAACWMSRAVMYPYFFLALVNQEKRNWFYFLLVVTVLYWTSMLGWGFQLGLVDWPFPLRLRAVWK